MGEYFDSLLAIDQVPKFNSIRLANNHTSGSRVGAYSIEAAIADNDRALGKLIEHLSQSKIWNESVVFVLEDDAQNGADHVDAHRSPAFVAGGLVKRKFVDHTMYSTSGMLRTIELILGLPPMSQYDAASMPMYRSFTDTANVAPFAHIPAVVDLDEMNLAENELSKESEGFDLSRADNVPDRQLNEVLWKSIKGYSYMPAPKRAAFVAIRKDGDKEDD